MQASGGSGRPWGKVAEGKPDNVRITSFGNGEEYLLRRLGPGVSEVGRPPDRAADAILERRFPARGRLRYADANADVTCRDPVDAGRHGRGR